MYERFHRWRERRLVSRHPIAEAAWQHALAHCGPARRLGASDQASLRVLTTRFLRRKSIEPTQGLVLDDDARVLLATHACLPILKLGLDWYRGWYSVIVYPDAFIPRREHMDEAGVVHASSHALAGEAWGRGPVILSWADIQGRDKASGHNVVVHEMAHKLDMLDGSANGRPPLHRGMDAAEWAEVFGQAWQDLQAASKAGQHVPIDVYGLTDPAEFFAVLSEHFFEMPADLRMHLPRVYRQLALLYRQSPAADEGGD